MVISTVKRITAVSEALEERVGEGIRKGPWGRDLNEVRGGGARISVGPFRPQSGLQEMPVATRKESGVLGFPSRRGVTHQVRLECDPDIPVAPGEEHYVLDPSLDEDSLP